MPSGWATRARDGAGVVELELDGDGRLPLDAEAQAAPGLEFQRRGARGGHGQHVLDGRDGAARDLLGGQLPADELIDALHGTEVNQSG
jgi:hypothetical protein